MNRMFKTSLIFCGRWFLFLAIFAGFFGLTSSSVYADVFTTSITTSGSVNINVSTAADHASVATDTVGVVSTCPLGYDLSIAATSATNPSFSDTTLYKSGDSTSTSIINTSAGTALSPASILGNDLGTWGYSLDSNTDINSDFIGLTSTSTTLVTKSTASATGGDQNTIYYGASVDTDVEPGSYSMSDNAVITYFLTPNVNCSSFTIVYNGNGNDANTTTMSLTHTVAENDTVNLAASNYQKAGYGFAGWSTVQLDPDNANFKTNLAAAVTAGKVYGPNETVTADATFLSQAVPVNNTNTITLYAIWVKPEQNTSTNQPMTLQEWTSTGACGTMNTGDVIALKDARDNNVYSIAKLKDGGCWMIENLRLENTAAHNSDGTLAQGYASSSWAGNFSGLADPETTNFSYTTNPNSLYYSDTPSATSTIYIDTSSFPSHRMPRYNNQNTASSVSDMTAWDGASNVYSLGNYYTWAAAMANTRFYRDVAYTDEDGKTSDTVNTSICPSGWRLPYGGDTGSGNGLGGFYYLNYKNNNDTNVTDATASNKLRSYPNNFVYSGVFGWSASTDRSVGGHYWTSTADGAQSSRFLNFSDSSVYPANNGVNKYFALSVRCVAMPTYTVSFNANNGTGTMDNQVIMVGESTNLSSNSFTRSGYDFVGWNTAADGSGTSYGNGQSVTDIASTYGTIMLYAQWEEACGNQNICYDKNASSGVEGTMGKQAANASTGVTLLASNYSRSGYGFAGWNTAPDYSGTFYGPQEDITTPADMSNGLKLYAIWVASAGSMQTDATSVCNGLTVAPTNGTASLTSVSALTDQRDGETYAIAKLADGKCWMIENLRLENTAAHNSDGTLAQGYGISTTYGSFSGLASAESANFDIEPVANSLYSTDGSTTNIIQGGNSSYYYSRIPRYNNINTPANSINRPLNPTSNTFSNSSTIVGMYSYGNYYTWAAAMANVKQYSSSTSIDDEGKTSETAHTSLCPLNWRLPYGGGSGNGATAGGFSNLDIQLGGTGTASNSSTTPTGTIMSNRWRSFPNNFIYSGNYNTSSARERGRYGYYWSSTAYSNRDSYLLYFDNTSVTPDSRSFKYYGHSIRCTLGS